MNKQALIDRLEALGECTFAEEHRKAVEDLCPDGKFTSYEWNEAYSIALIKAVAAMIAENEALLRTKGETLQD